MIKNLLKITEKIDQSACFSKGGIIPIGMALPVWPMYFWEGAPLICQNDSATYSKITDKFLNLSHFVLPNIWLTWIFFLWVLLHGRDELNFRFHFSHLWDLKGEAVAQTFKSKYLNRIPPCRTKMVTCVNGFLPYGCLVDYVVRILTLGESLTDQLEPDSILQMDPTHFKLRPLFQSVNWF